MTPVRGFKIVRFALLDVEGIKLHKPKILLVPRKYYKTTKKLAQWRWLKWGRDIAYHSLALTSNEQVTSSSIKWPHFFYTSNIFGGRKDI